MTGVLIPENRPMPKGTVGNNKVSLERGKEDVVNYRIKEVEQGFNLVSIRNIGGETFKFYNPLTKDEAFDIVNYMNKYYVQEEGREGDWNVEEITPWNGSKSMVGLMFSGYPVHVDEPIAKAQSNVEEGIVDPNIDIAPLHKVSKFKGVNHNQLKHRNKVQQHYWN